MAFPLSMQLQLVLVCVCVSLICIEEEDNQGQIECKHADSTNKSWKGVSTRAAESEKKTVHGNCTFATNQKFNC